MNYERCPECNVKLSKGWHESNCSHRTDEKNRKCLEEKYKERCACKCCVCGKIEYAEDEWLSPEGWVHEFLMFCNECKDKFPKKKRAVLAELNVVRNGANNTLNAVDRIIEKIKDSELL